MDDKAPQTSTPFLHDGVREDTEPSGGHGTQPASRKTKIVVTVFIYTAMTFLGMATNLLGPALLDLEYLTNSTTKSISPVFNWRYGGYFLGTILVGPIIDRVDEKFVLGVAQAGLGVSTAITPLCSVLITLFVISSFAGFSQSVNTVTMSAVLIRLWGDASDPFQQALHFFVAVGGSMSPQIMKPFLRIPPTMRQDNSTNLTNHTLQGISPQELGQTSPSLNAMFNSSEPRQMPFSDLNSTFQHFTTKAMMHLTGLSDVTSDANTTGYVLDAMPGSQVKYCFFIVGALLMMGCIFGLSIFICQGCHFRRQNVTPEKTVKEDKTLIEGKGKVLILIMFTLIAFLHGGLEETNWGMLMTFAVKHLKVDKNVGSDMVTMFWVTCTIARASSVIICRYIKPSVFLGIEVTLILVSNLILTFTINLHWVTPWVCIAVSGIGVSSIMPSILNWAKSCISLKGKETAIIFSGFAGMKMLSPALLGYLFEVHTPMWFVYILIIYSSSALLIYISNCLLIFALSRQAKEEQEKRDIDKKADLL